MAHFVLFSPSTGVIKGAGLWVNGVIERAVHYACWSNRGVRMELRARFVTEVNLEPRMASLCLEGNFS